LRLTDEIESLDVKRLEYLAQLACIRRVPLSELLDQLGIPKPTYA